jgi:hypothetical protein
MPEGEDDAATWFDGYIVGEWLAQKTRVMSQKV